MTSSYRPDPGALPVSPWSTAALAQRDLEVQIPINYITYPGVSISAACFSNSVYADDTAGRCFSNLLAMGFRRFEIDAFWDPTRRLWSLCPVQLAKGNVSSSNTSSTGSTVSSVSTTVPNPSTRSSAAKRDLRLRQVTSSAGSSSLGAATTATASLSTTSSTAPSEPSSSLGNNGMVSVGDYSCSPSLNLDSWTGVLVDYFKQTSTNLGARMTYLSLNLHVSSPSSGSSASLDSSQVPRSNEQLHLALSSLSDELYTPVTLRSDRQNINSSWLQSQANSKPDLAYIPSSSSSNRQLMTQSGWPNEGLIQFQKRLIISLGTIDSQLQDYNTSLDFTLYHKASDMSQSHAVSINSSGVLTDGCFYNTSSTAIANVNNSWATTALSSLNSTGFSYLPSISSLTSCGISPFLNSSLSQSTADTNITPFQSVSYSSIWSWGFNEPRNVSTSEANAKRIRCAALDINMSGHWRVVDCADQHLAACRIGNHPYEWRLSTNKGSYTSQDVACPGNSSFAVPRTGLENTYLMNAFMQAQSRNSDIAADSLIWLNFNSLDTSSCWVQGVKSTCPYGGGAQQSSKRQVVIPIVAAVIVLVIAALLLFVKCAANRRNHKRGRKRRGKEEAGEYEGVPS